MDQAGNDQGANIIGRLERIPFTHTHRNFIFMVAGGEFVESMMLLGNGAMLAIMAHVLHFSAAESAYVVPSAFFIGEFIGSFSIGYLSDRFGRRTMFSWDLLIFAAGLIIAGFLSNPWAIGLFVLIAGIGVGGEFPLVDTYTAEIFPGKQRGKRIAMVYTLAVLAAPILVGIAYLVSHPAPGAYSWRVLFWGIAILALIAWYFRLRIPESPRWLAAQGRHDEAEAIVAKMEQQAKEQYGLTELPEPRLHLASNQTRGQWSELFGPQLRSRTIMMLVFEFFQTGIFYGFTALAPTFLVHKGITLAHSLLFTMIIFLGFFIGSIVNMSFIDKVDRKWGIVGTTILAGICGTLFATAANETATVIFGFLTAFCLWNFSNFEHTFESELFPTRVRSMAAGTVYSVSRISTSLWVALIATFFLPKGLVPTFTFIWFFVVVVVLAVGIWGPKTAGRHLEEIAQ